MITTLNEWKKLNESKKLISDVASPKKNKMHDVLGINKDTKISDVYTSGKKLAEDLVTKVGKKKATGMLAFVANINKEEDIFDRALRALDRVNESEEVKDDDYYAKKYINDNKLITHPDIKSKEDIEKIIEASEGELNTFLKNVAKLDYPVKLSKSRDYYKYSTEKIFTGSGKFGLFENVVEYVYFFNFSGGKITSTTHKGEFYFSPIIWFGNLNIGYQDLSGGSNAMNYCFYKNNHRNPDGAIWFDILNNKYKTSNDFK